METFYRLVEWRFLFPLEVSEEDIKHEDVYYRVSNWFQKSREPRSSIGVVLTVFDDEPHIVVIDDLIVCFEVF